MSAQLSIWTLFFMILGCMLFGYWVGADGKGVFRRGEEEEKENGDNKTEKVSAKKEHVKRSSLPKEGWAVGSPASGDIRVSQEGDHKTIKIQADQGKLYAPVAGKIVKLFPTGNAFLLRTEYGIDLRIRVGINTEELEGLYFRPRVVQNEIVGKGKLLLEFDINKIQAEGYDTDIIVSIEETKGAHDITMTEAQRVKSGEELLWVATSS